MSLDTKWEVSALDAPPERSTAMLWPTLLLFLFLLHPSIKYEEAMAMVSESMGAMETMLERWSNRGGMRLIRFAI